ncbi:MAG: efflux RND transporter periplasmic adaptor subunit [Azonexus sp.]|nr:efflux RND transporter periplasmic adaptor subunit [Azonexus sp.]MDZ4315385.1 efflux RND transporter periplasmic adaptor subunit [Azonexus sp.]
MFRITLPASLLFAAALLLSACQAGDPPAAAKRLVLVQPASSAAASSGSHAGVYTGEIRARHEFDLAFRVAGKLAARLVDAGAEIKPGQALAKLDPADLELAANAARAQLAAAESDLATAQAERQRYADLLSKKFVSQGAFEAKENAFRSSQARLEQARSQSRISGNQASYGILSSEHPAIVTAVLADAGQVLSIGQPVFRLARPEEKEVLIAVPESRLAELRKARTLAVNLWAEPKIMMTGELRELAPAADATTRTYAARIRIHNPPPEVRLGMTARVALDLASDNLLLVPLSAVLDQGNGPQVWVVSNGKTELRAVKVKQFGEAGAVISEGLQTGELVVVIGASKLVAGLAVETKIAPRPSEQR